MNEEQYTLAMERGHAINAYHTLMENSFMLTDDETQVLITTLLTRLDKEILSTLLSKLPEEILCTLDITSSQKK